ncbi:MAG: prolyl oligopeptidase family serine peptidase [Clostridia bacterium]|nr:prolyl oligopeptidase family serine peptidase [Clostridia bacterium]
MKEATFEGMNYIINYPADYKEGEKYPVIIFLHGAGTRGKDMERLKTHAYFTITAQHEGFPFITAAPHCPEGTWFDMFEVLKRFTKKIVCSEFADKDRIYLTGASMGGYAAWQLAMSMPELFAAIVPICGGGMCWYAGRLVNVPVWAFHAEKDSTVNVEESKKMVEAVNEKGGSAKLTVYTENHTGNDHDAWTDTYKNPEVFIWLLSHRNKNLNTSENKFEGSNIYG